MKRFSFSVMVLVFCGLVSGAQAYHYFEPPAEGWSPELNKNEVSHAIGTVINVLPDGARSVLIQGVQYFVTDNNWYRPINVNGIKYMAVFAPVG